MKKSLLLVLLLCSCDSNYRTEQQRLEDSIFESGVQAGIHGVLVLEKQHLDGQNVPIQGELWMDAVRKVAYESAKRTDNFYKK